MKEIRKDIIVAVMVTVFIISATVVITTSASIEAEGDEDDWSNFITLPGEQEMVERFDGTWVHYIHIYTPNELAWVASSHANASFVGNAQIFILERDIDLSDHLWIPIGDSVIPFEDVFDGKDHVISGLRIDAPDKDDQGLFGTTKLGAIIRNLGVTGDVIGNDNVGGIIGNTQGTVFSHTVMNCYFIGNVKGNDNVGGMVGDASHIEVSNCYTAGTVKGNNNVGGIAGVAIYIDHSYNLSTVEGVDKVGGIVGDAGNRWEPGIFGYCYNAGIVIGEDGRFGTIVGIFSMDHSMAQMYGVDLNGDVITTRYAGTVTFTAEEIKQGKSSEVMSGLQDGRWIFEKDTLSIFYDSVDGVLKAELMRSIYPQLIVFAKNGNTSIEEHSAMMTSDGNPININGLQGPEGSQGSSGGQGQQGLQGEQGASGSQGIQGDQGPSGKDGTVSLFMILICTLIGAIAGGLIVYYIVRNR